MGIRDHHLVLPVNYDTEGCLMVELDGLRCLLTSSRPTTFGYQSGTLHILGETFNYPSSDNKYNDCHPLAFENCKKSSKGQIDILLGWDVLSQFQVLFDIGHGQIVLAKNRLKLKHGQEVPYCHFALPCRPWDNAGIDKEFWLPLMTVDGRHYLFMIDGGLASSCLLDFDDIAIGRPLLKMVDLHLPSAGRNRRLPAFDFPCQIGNLEMNIPMGLFPEQFFDWWMNNQLVHHIVLGVKGFLDCYTVLMDNPNNRLFIAPAATNACTSAENEIWSQIDEPEDCVGTELLRK